MLTPREVSLTADSIESCQLKNGMILWHENGHSDPWNHVEAAMALSVSSRFKAAEKAYEWLMSSQRPDGSWYNYYRSDSIEDFRIDTNVCAYPSVGVWQHYLMTGDKGFLETMWTTVERALNFVLSLQVDTGEIIWCVEPDGEKGKYALLTGSSSISMSLAAGIGVASVLGEEKPEWELGLLKLNNAIKNHPYLFEPKEEYAMDWYYPVLAGIKRGEDGKMHLKESWDTFVMDGLGVRCVSYRPWVTAAETAECALALDALDLKNESLQMLSCTNIFRQSDGSYLTGIVFPENATFPHEETTTYTSGAILLANAALTMSGSAAHIFRKDGLISLFEDSYSVSDPL